MDIMADWLGEGVPQPKIILQYTIRTCGTLPVYWAIFSGTQGECGFVVENEEVRFELYFSDDVTDEQRQKAISFFQERIETSI